MTLKPAAFVAIILACAVVLALAPLMLPPFYVRVGQLMLYSAGLGVAWTILGGFAGYASFGQAALSIHWTMPVVSGLRMPNDSNIDWWAGL